MTVSSSILPGAEWEVGGGCGGGEEGSGSGSGSEVLVTGAAGAVAFVLDFDRLFLKITLPTSLDPCGRGDLTLPSGPDSGPCEAEEGLCDPSLESTSHNISSMREIFWFKRWTSSFTSTLKSIMFVMISLYSAGVPAVGGRNDSFSLWSLRMIPLSHESNFRRLVALVCLSSNSTISSMVSWRVIWGGASPPAAVTFCNFGNTLFPEPPADDPFPLPDPEDLAGESLPEAGRELAAVVSLPESTLEPRSRPHLLARMVVGLATGFETVTSAEELLPLSASVTFDSLEAQMESLFSNNPPSLIVSSFSPFSRSGAGVGLWDWEAWACSARSRRNLEKIFRTRWSWFWSSCGSFLRLSASSFSLLTSATFRNINCKKEQLLWGKSDLLEMKLFNKLTHH